MVYSVGQSNSLTGAGSVSMPVYDNGSIKDDQYPCKYQPVDLFKRPKQIPLGFYDSTETAYPLDEYYKENYVENTQHKKAGELTDIEILLGIIVLFIIVSYVLYKTSK